MTTELYTQLAKSIKGLSKDQAVVFGTEVCKHLLPDYEKFQKKHGWGDYLLLEDTIKKIEKKELKYSELKPLIQKIKEIIPDTEEFGEFDGSYALNSSASVLELVEYLVDNNKSHISNISGYSTDTIDFKLQENHPGLSDKELENHPLLIDELNKQVRLTKNNIT